MRVDAFESGDDFVLEEGSGEVGYCSVVLEVGGSEERHMGNTHVARLRWSLSCTHSASRFAPHLGRRRVVAARRREIAGFWNRWKKT